ncbi:hypothetical protein [Persephonella sp.]
MRIFLYLIFFVVLLFLPVKGAEIGIKNPSLRNLPSQYRIVILNFFLGNYKNTEKYSRKKEYLYTVKPFLSSIAGSYNMCLDIFHKNSLKEVICFSAEDGEGLSERLFNLPEKTDIFSLSKKPHRKEVYLKVLTVSKKFDRKLKVTSRNGDILVGYTDAEEFKGQEVEHITVGNGIINIDTVILDNREASRLFEYILNGYRIKGILIIKTY